MVAHVAEVVDFVSGSGMDSEVDSKVNLEVDGEEVLEGCLLKRREGSKTFCLLGFCICSCLYFRFSI